MMEAVWFLVVQVRKRNEQIKLLVYALAVAQLPSERIDPELVIKPVVVLVEERA